MITQNVLAVQLSMAIMKIPKSLRTGLNVMSATPGFTKVVRRKMDSLTSHPSLVVIAFQM